MRKLLIVPASLAILLSNAQQTRTVDVDKNDVQVVGNHFYFVGSEPVSATKYVKVVEGTPYFSENWMKGKVMMPHGTIYEDLVLRLDLLAQNIQYIDPEGKEMTATSSVRMVFLKDTITGREYNFEHSSFLATAKPADNGWYQVLFSGAVACYKRINKKVTEMRPYGSATVEQAIFSNPQYYVLADSVLYPVRRIKDIPGILSNKKAELNAYISSRNLNGKSDADFSDIISYYNDLVAK